MRIKNKPITLDVTFEHEADTPIPQLGKQHLAIRHTKAWVRWLFSLANLFRVDLSGIDCLHDTIDCGDVECTSVSLSFEDGQTIVTAEYKGKVEDE